MSRSAACDSSPPRTIRSGRAGCTCWLRPGWPICARTAARSRAATAGRLPTADRMMFAALMTPLGEPGAGGEMTSRDAWTAAFLVAIFAPVVVRLFASEWQSMGRTVDITGLLATSLLVCAGVAVSGTAWSMTVRRRWRTTTLWRAGRGPGRPDALYRPAAGDRPDGAPWSGLLPQGVVPERARRHRDRRRAWLIKARATSPHNAIGFTILRGALQLIWALLSRCRAETARGGWHRGCQGVMGRRGR